ncbi:MAG: hypothetical protein LBR50_06570 [Tannerella sp.]|nr:hypothetical protein [Tannerella sp.]
MKAKLIYHCRRTLPTMAVCIAALVFSVLTASAQSEITVEKPVSDVKPAFDIPTDYSQDLINLRWNELISSNILNEIRYAEYYNSYFGTIDSERAYTLYSSQNLVPGIMLRRDAGGNMLFQLNDRFILTTGAYALQYRTLQGVYNDAVATMSVDYSPANWLTIGAWGQYSAFSRYNAMHGSMVMDPFVPSSAFGVSGTAMFNDAIGVQGIVGRQINPVTGKWKTVYGISPVINFNKLFK